MRHRLGRDKTWLLMWVLCGCRATAPGTPPTAENPAPETPPEAARIHGPEGDSPTFAAWRGAHLPMKEVKPGLFAATLVGDMASAGVYVLRVRVVPHGSVAPHSHPDGRLTTVLSGTIHSGRSDTINPERAQVFGPGDSYYTPPNTPHWLTTGPEGTVYEEIGFGPSAQVPVTPPGP